MALNYSLLDVFADAPFQGTQIPVVLFENTLSNSDKTLIAGEFQQTETVFIETTATGQPPRVFNSDGETHFGAHTTLAAAYTAQELGLTENQGDYASYDIQQPSGVIQCFIDTPPAGIGSIQFSRVLDPSIDRFTPSLSLIARALNIDEKHLSYSKYRPMAVSIDNPTLIVPLTKPEHVVAARLDADLWSDLLAEIYATNIFLFSPKSQKNQTDFHGRLLNPRVAHGVFPPIGNVMPEFISYLVEQQETAEGTHTFSIDRGSDNTRRSVLHVEFDKRPGKTTRCRIGGRVIKMGKGSLYYPHDPLAS